MFPTPSSRLTRKTMWVQCTHKHAHTVLVPIVPHSLLSNAWQERKTSEPYTCVSADMLVVCGGDVTAWRERDEYSWL